MAYGAAYDASAALAPLQRCTQLRRLHLNARPAAVLHSLCTLTQLTAIRLGSDRGGGLVEEDAEEVHEASHQGLPSAVPNGALLGLQVCSRPAVVARRASCFCCRCVACSWAALILLPWPMPFWVRWCRFFGCGGVVFLGGVVSLFLGAVVSLFCVR